eukprot:760272-Hanusia_phi.AAC.3
MAEGRCRPRRDGSRRQRAPAPCAGCRRGGPDHKSAASSVPSSICLGGRVPEAGESAAAFSKRAPGTESEGRAGAAGSQGAAGPAELPLPSDLRLEA